MDNGKKNSQKVLTTNDIRKHARDWTLAGDVGLLAHLEQFSENIINKTQETQNNINELVDHYEELYTKVGNTTNQFLALQNCQFVENRVYDEETPTEEKTEIKVKDEAEREKLLLMQYKEAVEVGVKILDTHFQEVQLPPNSDSDEEDEYSVGNSVIWKPKNPYASKKFPLLIGSAEWWADDHVGLGTNEEGLDTEKIISDSESEMESLKSNEKTVKSSSSSSVENLKAIPKKPVFLESSTEDLFGFDRNENQQNEDLSKESSSRLEEPGNFLPDYENERNEKIEIPPQEQPEEEKDRKEQINIDKPKKVDNAFTRELMAKLVSVTNKNEKVEEKPLPRVEPTSVKIDDENLFDETDDSSNLFSTTKVNKIQKKIVESKGLFDGDEDDKFIKGETDLFSGDDLFKITKSQPFDKNIFESPSAAEISEKKEAIAVKKNLVSDLFDDLDDDDTLFAPKPVTHKSVEKSLPSMETEVNNKSNSVSNVRKVSWENEEGLFDSINTEIDDDFFNSSGLFDIRVNKTAESSVATGSKPNDVGLFPTERQDKTKPGLENSIEKSLLDSKNFKIGKDSFDNSFGFTLPKEPSNKKITLLDSDEDDDLFSKSCKDEKKPSVKVLTLPDGEEDDDDTALFAEKPKPPDSVSISSSRSSLFDDVSASKSRLASVFEKDKVNKPEGDLFDESENSLFGGGVKPEKDLFSTKGWGKGKSSSLFDDCDDGDDLFGGVKKEEIKKKEARENQAESVKKIQEDIFQEEKKEPLQFDSFMNDLGDHDLFKATKPSAKIREAKTEGIQKSELFADDLDDGELFSDKLESTKPKPPSSLSLKTKQSESNTKSVGKLNIPDNLKARFESVAKHISPGVRGTKPPVEEKKIDEKEISDEPLQSSNLLKCPSKNRVRIPGRRRPQSRRARQEAVRNSGVWDEPISPNTSSNATQPKDSLPSPAPSNPLSPSTDEEDFFKVPELDMNFEKEDQSIFKSDLFESDKSSKLDDNLLFDGAPVLSPLSPRKTAQADKKREDPSKAQETDSLFGSAKTKTASLFDEDDDNFEGGDDENLFKTSKPPNRNSALFHTEEKNIDKSKKSIFDIDFDDEEDDLFGKKLHETPLDIQKPKEGTGEGGRKEKENSSFIDPLGLMSKDE